MTTGVPVLMYHGLGEPAPHGESHYTFPPETFARHLDLFRQEGRAVISLDALLSGGAPDRAVVVTFDDGEQSVARLALPLMRERGMVGTLFVTTGWIGSPGYVGDEDLAQLKQAGWTVGTHGVTHRFLSDLPRRQLREELVQSRDELTRVMGDVPVHMSLPGGRESGPVVQAVQAAGYQSLSTSTVGINRTVDPFALQRVMMIRPFDDSTVKRIIGGDPLFYLKLRGRQTALGFAKRAVGNRRYEQLRGVAFRVLRGIRRR